MVVTRAYIRELRKQARLHIPPELEQLLLERLGSDPSPYAYTEQDLYEQSRKIIRDYQEAVRLQGGKEENR